MGSYSKPNLTVNNAPTLNDLRTALAELPRVYGAGNFVCCVCNRCSNGREWAAHPPTPRPAPQTTPRGSEQAWIWPKAGYTPPGCVRAVPVGGRRGAPWRGHHQIDTPMCWLMERTKHRHGGAPFWEGFFVGSDYWNQTWLWLCGCLRSRTLPSEHQDGDRGLDKGRGPGSAPEDRWTDSKISNTYISRPHKVRTPKAGFWMVIS